MIGKINTITNTCNGKTIEMDCCNFGVADFDWRSIERRNKKYNFDTQNGGYSSCYRDNIREISLTIIYMGDTPLERGALRSEIDSVFTNLDCCDTCCNLEIDMTDDDGKEYIISGKLGSSVVRDTVDGFNIIHEHKFAIEVCGDIKGKEEFEVCGVLGSLCGVSNPVCGDCIKTEYNGSEIVNFGGNICGGFTMTIQGNPIENLQIRNITTGGRYGILGTVNGEIVLDESGKVTENGILVDPSRRIPGSSINSIKLTNGENEILVTGIGEGTWCINYTNDIS